MSDLCIFLNKSVWLACFSLEPEVWFISEIDNLNSLLKLECAVAFDSFWMPAQFVLDEGIIVE